MAQLGPGAGVELVELGYVDPVSVMEWALARPRRWRVPLMRKPGDPTW